MFILKLRYFFSGYLRITVRGKNTEKLINLAIQHKISLWDIKRRAELATLKVDLDSFYDLRHLARRTGCRLHIEQKAGLPILYHRLMRRRGMVIGLSVFFISLYLISSFILFVGVVGNENLTANYIRELAADSGAYRGLLKRRLDTDAVANKMLIAQPDLAWVGIQVKGTRLIIEVVEAEKPIADVDTTANLVAAKDGLITEIVVIVGKAKVKVGDTVRRGQVLIEGMLRPQAQYAAEPDSSPSSMPVRARGEVTARVWYEGYGEAALTEMKRVQTGRKTSVWTLLVEDQPVLRVGRAIVGFVNYNTVTASNQFSERIFRFPVEIITETFYEVELQEMIISQADALVIATKRAKTLAELQLPAKETIETEAVKQIVDEIEGFVGVRYVIETSENIAVLELIDGGED